MKRIKFLSYVLATFALSLFLTLNVQSQKLTKPNEPGPMPGIRTNTFTGNIVTPRKDLEIPEKGVSIDVVFTYNSLLKDENHGFGFGWNASFHDPYLPLSLTMGMAFEYSQNPVAVAELIIEDETITIPRSDGQKDVFILNGNIWNPPVGVYDQLEEYETGKWKLTSKYGIITFYDDLTHNYPTSVVDRNENTVSYGYSGGKLQQVTGPSGRQIQFTWTGDYMTQITDPNPEIPRIFQYQYDENGNMVQYTDPMGNVTAYSYDEFGNMTSITDPLENLVEIAYDDEMAVAEISCADVGYSKSFVYDIEEHSTIVTQFVSSGSRETTYFFDELDRVNKILHPDGNYVLFGWDESNNLTSYNDENGNTTSFTYDDFGNIVSSTDCLGSTLNILYGSMPIEILSYTDKLGNTTFYTYDDSGNLLTETDCLGNSNTFTYDDFGNILTLTNMAGFTNTFTYDAYGNILTNTDALGNVSSSSYDPVGNLISETDRNGCISDYEYDPLNRLNKETDALGFEWDYEYDDNGNLVSDTDKNSCSSYYEYDPLNRESKETDGLGFEWDYEYDEAGSLITETDPLGNTTSFTYDSRSRLITEADCLGYSSGYLYDPLGNLISGTSKNGNTTTYEYDCLNRLVRLTDPRGESEEYEYDQLDRRITTTDKNGNATTYDYDCLGRLLRTTDPAASEETYEYNQLGNRTSVTDKNGNTTTNEYDELGRLVKVIDPLGFFEEHTYDAEGSNLSFINKNGVATTFAYNCMGMVISKTDILGNSELFDFDAMANIVGYTDKNGDTTIYAFDCLQNLIKITDPLANEESYGYDAAGNRISISDNNGNTTSFDFDCRNMLSTVTDPLGNQESYTYDADGHRVTYTNKNGHTTSYAYNCCWLISETDPLGNTKSYSYDANGNQIETINKNGHSTVFEYDILNQHIGTTDALGNINTQNYDPVGNRISETDANGNVTTYTYDDLNRLSNRTNALGYISNYAYDPTGNLIAETDANGNTLNYSYDDLNRLSNITDALGYVSSYSYDPLGRRIFETDANGQTTAHQYDAVGNLIQSTTPMGFQTLYTYDPESNQQTQVDANGNQIDYSYDPLNRLISKDYPDGSGITRSYDASGNLVSTSNSAGIGDVITYSYDPINRLITKATNYGSFSKSISYTYDNMGYRASLTSEAGTIGYSYNALGRLIEITDQNLGLTTFDYDAVGNQITTNYPNGVVSFSSFDQLNHVTEVVTSEPPTDFFKRKSPDYKAKIPNDKGFFIDCVVVDIISPLSGPGLTDNETVTIVLGNFGLEPVFEAMVSYNLDGGEPVVEFITQAIFPNEFIEHTFEFPANLSIAGQTYELTACIEAPGDENPANDCFTSIITNEEGGEGVYQSFNYEYDPVSNKISELHEDGTLIGFIYDANNQLLSETYSPLGETIEYTYTPTGKRSSKTEDGIYSPYLYNTDDVLTEAGLVTFTVDNIGNRLSKTDPEGTSSYQYNFNNELVQVILPDLSTTHFDYSATGEELLKNENGASSFLHSDFGISLEEFDDMGVLSTSFNPLFSINSGGQTGYYHYNGFKSSTLLSGTAAEELASAEFDSYGNPTTDGVWINDWFMFKTVSYDSDIDGYDTRTGKMFDQSTGTFYNPSIASLCGSHGHCVSSNDCLCGGLGFSGDLVAKGGSSGSGDGPGSIEYPRISLGSGLLGGLVLPGVDFCPAKPKVDICADKCKLGKVRNCKVGKLIKSRVDGGSPKDDAEAIAKANRVTPTSWWSLRRDVVIYWKKVAAKRRGIAMKKKIEAAKRFTYRVKVTWEKCESTDCTDKLKQNDWVNKKDYYNCWRGSNKDKGLYTSSTKSADIKKKCTKAAKKLCE